VSFHEIWAAVATVIQLSAREDVESAYYPALATSTSDADGCSPVPLVENQFSAVPGVFPSSTPGVDFRLGPVEERPLPAADVVSLATDDGPVEETSVQVVEEGRKMESVMARRLKRASDVDVAFKRVSRELQDARSTNTFLLWTVNTQSDRMSSNKL